LRDHQLSTTSIDDNAVGLQALIVDTNDVRGLRPIEGKLSVAEAAQRLSVHPDTVRYLIRSGALQRTDRKLRMLDEDALRQAQNDLVHCATLSRQLHRSSRAIMSHASRLGVSARHGPPACRNILFDRGSARLIATSLGKNAE
jgi:excisionase family DNA binding protein